MPKSLNNFTSLDVLRSAFLTFGSFCITCGQISHFRGKEEVLNAWGMPPGEGGMLMFQNDVSKSCKIDEITSCRKNSCGMKRRSCKHFLLGVITNMYCFLFTTSNAYRITGEGLRRILCCSGSTLANPHFKHQKFAMLLKYEGRSAPTATNLQTYWKVWNSTIKTVQTKLHVSWTLVCECISPYFMFEHMWTQLFVLCE